MSDEILHLTIETSLPVLAYDLAADLEGRGLGKVQVKPGPEAGLSLVHAPGLSAGGVARLLEAIRPLEPESVGPEQSLPPGHAVLNLGKPSDCGECSVDIHADSQDLLTRAGELLEALGMKRGDSYLEVVDRNHLQHNGAALAARQLLRWGMSRGVKVPDSGPGSDSDTNSITLYAIDPEQAARPMRERFGLRLLTDDLAAVEELRQRLESEGFRVEQIELLNPEGMGDQPRFKLEAGPFAPRRAPSELARLRVAVEDLLSRHGIDPARFPLQVSDRSRAAQAVVELPLARLRGPAARPYAGSFPERFALNIHTDAPDQLGVLQDALREGGFVRQTVKLVPSLLDRPHEEMPAGMQLRWANAGRDAAVAAALRLRVEQAAKAVGSALTLEAFDRTGDSDEVDLYFPVKGVGDGKLAAWLCDPRRYRLRLQGLEGDDAGEIETALKGMGFAGVEVMDGTPRVRGRIDHGTAPMALVEKLQDRLRGLLGSQLQTFRAAVDEPVITIQLPKRAAKKPAAKDAAPSAPTIDLAAWLHEPDAPLTPLFEVGPRCVRIGRVTLERRDADGPMVPDLSSFDHYCLDETTATTLEHIAASVLLREPCLLEGETSTSKTSGVLYLAGLLRQPVVRINLNGQTDTGELIGRYVPRDDDAGGRTEWEEEGEEGTLAIRERAAVGGSLWRWQDGLIVQAMKHGWWVLLDEVNLAEPQILERLNSVLETEPSLVLTEHENEPIAPIHPSFRVFATMNPAEYAGRSVLSPAYRDRWRGYRFVPRPGEREYLAMLRLLIHGDQPDVVVQGRKYAGHGEGNRNTPATPRYATLKPLLPDEVLIGLARFQSSLEHAAGRGGEAPRLGVRRKERHVFTRRGLLSVLDYLLSPLGNGEPTSVRQALARYYLGRVHTTEDQAVVVHLLDAAGLGPTRKGAGG